MVVAPGGGVVGAAAGGGAAGGVAAGGVAAGGAGVTGGVAVGGATGGCVCCATAAVASSVAARPAETVRIAFVFICKFPRTQSNNLWKTSPASESPRNFSCSYFREAPRGVNAQTSRSPGPSQMMERARVQCATPARAHLTSLGKNSRSEVW